jgi:hypothetical protein
MSLPPDLSDELERAIPHLSGTPATAFLASGRRARRRRRAYAAVGGAAVLTAVGGAMLSLTGAPSSPDSATEPGASTSPTAAIPDWAEEYGNHGPVSIAPDGELWVAPDARLIRSVEIPATTFPGGDVVSAYAAEAEMDGDLHWSFVYRTDGMVLGEMDDPGRWTNDFDVWVEDVSSQPQEGPSFAERLVRFADDSSERLVPREGVDIVRQSGDVALGPAREEHPRSAAAEVVYEGRTWFVLAEGPRVARPFYAAYEPAVVGAAGLPGFLDYLGSDVGE